MPTPVTIPSARQGSLLARAVFTVANLASGVFLPLINIPTNAIIVSGFLSIDTAFTSATSDGFSIGDQVGVAAATPAAYAASTTAIRAGNLATPIVATGKLYTAPAQSIGVVWTATGTASTVGAGSLVVEYIIDGRQETTFG